MYQKQEPLIFHEKRFSQYNTTSVDPLKFLHVDISFLTPPIMASAPHPWLLCKYYTSTSTRAVNRGSRGFHSAQRSPLQDTRAFSLMKEPTSAFTIKNKNLSKHFAIKHGKYNWL